MGEEYNQPQLSEGPHVNVSVPLSESEESSSRPEQMHENILD